MKAPCSTLTFEEPGVAESHDWRGLHHVSRISMVFLTEKLFSLKKNASLLFFSLYNFIEIDIENMENLEKARADAAFSRMATWNEAGAEMEARA